MTEPARYREWRTAPDLARHVVCTWAGRFGAAGEQYTDRVLPDGCIDIVWTGAGVVVAGPDTRCVSLEWRPGARFAGVRFRPGFAPALLGVAASALVDTRAELRDVIGARAAGLDDRLARAPSLRAAADVLAASVRAWLPAGAPADGAVQAAIAHLRESEPASSVAALAANLGVSERQLHRRFVAAVGYGPKLLQRIMRFRRFLVLGAEPDKRSIAALALEAGYADHAHLVHDCQQLAGLPPGRLLGHPITGA
jgi:AraC-like DNA-binding protein